MSQVRHFTAVIQREGNVYVPLCPELDIASQGLSVEAGAKGGRSIRTAPTRSEPQLRPPKPEDRKQSVRTINVACRYKRPGLRCH